MKEDTYVCAACKEEVEHVDSLFHLCIWCKKKRDREYDDYVDSQHWYHQHNPDRSTEG